MAQDRAKSSNGRVPRSSEDVRHKPTRTLPTERVGAEKQLQILRAYAIASGPAAKPVLVGDAASIVKMAATTVSLCSAFFKDVGLLNRTSEGQLTPAQEVFDFNRAYEWSPQTAASKLAPLLERAWFGDHLLPRTRFGALTQEQAITELAAAAGAAPVYRPNLLILLDLLEAAGLITRENGQVRSPSPASGQPPSQPAEQSDNEDVRDPPTRDSTPRLATAFSQQEGVVQFHVSVKVNMSEFAGWHPDRISSFFAGIAQVLAAKGSVEGTAGGTR